jgi:uncharacterized protein (TIGR02599 family)
MIVRTSPQRPHSLLTRCLRRCGFTLVELLVSMAVLGIILLVSTSIITETQKAWNRNSARMEQFREARVAFEHVSNSISQATLNSYSTYRYNNGPNPTVPATKSEAPIGYIRHSELQFITGQATQLLPTGAGNVAGSHAIFFQAPLGITHTASYKNLTQLLCGAGYFIMYGDDANYRPGHVATSRTRFRLMEYRQPAESNEVYTAAPGQWFRNALNDTIGNSETLFTAASTRPVAQNIVALVILPQIGIPGADETINASYAYDSAAISNSTIRQPQGTQHLLPTSVRITLVAIDEASAQRLDEAHPGAQPQLLAAGAFSDASRYQHDLEVLERKLQDEKLTYRVFSASVNLGNVQWEMY